MSTRLLVALNQLDELKKAIRIAEENPSRHTKVYPQNKPMIAIPERPR